MLILSKRKYIRLVIDCDYSHKYIVSIYQENAYKELRTMHSTEHNPHTHWQLLFLTSGHILRLPSAVTLLEILDRGFGPPFWVSLRRWRKGQWSSQTRSIQMPLTEDLLSARCPSSKTPGEEVPLSHFTDEVP